MSLRRTSRFERKILVALVTVALVPLVGALVLGQRVLREAYEVGVNPGVEAQLEKGLTLHREQLELLRERATLSAEALALAYQAGDRDGAAPPLDSLLTRYEGIARLRVLDAQGAELAKAENAALLGDDMRPLVLVRPLDAEGAQLEVTAAAPSQLFLAHQRAGELYEVFTRLRRETALVSSFYLVVYMGFLLSVIAVAVAAGIVLSRRVTRRVEVLAEATERVGRGDLEVQVPSDVDDEIGDLTLAFNDMVRDLRESRGRIDYLQRISAWQEFARRLAHEIKNPLTPIQLAMQEVHQSYRGDDENYKKRLDDALAIIEEEVATLRRLVGEFSAFAKLPQASLEDADLRDVVRDMERSLQLVPEDCGARDAVQVSLVLPSGTLPVRVDAMMLKRALDNLVRNAVQAITQRTTLRAGTPGQAPATGRVEVRVSPRGDHALIEVADDGPGIPERDRGRVFDPYFTTKSEGTGLGLAIVKKVALEHGGEIEDGVSDLGGAAFRLSLPLRHRGPRTKAE